MTQQGTIKLLERSKKPLTTKQIAKKLGIGTATAAVSIRKLINQDLIQSHPYPSKYHNLVSYTIKKEKK